MKKLQLKIQELNNSEVLNRKQLKEILGGVGSDSGSGSGTDCRTYGEQCYARFNCCSGLQCDPMGHHCW